MKSKYKYLAAYIFMLLSVASFSCSENKKLEEGRKIRITELMASNRTGLINDKKQPADWIEIQNTSADSLNLAGFQMSIIKAVPDTINPGDTIYKNEKWVFPDVKIGGGDYMVIFADKGKSKDSKDPGILSADFKLPKEGATIQFLSPKGKVISELSYGSLSPDHSLALQADSTYVTTVLQSPGFENNTQGYEKAIEKMDKQRKGPLLIWELMSREQGSNTNWVELKNLGDKEIDLSEYSLAKKVSKEEGWKLPQRKLQPGEIITIQLVGKKANPNNPLHADFKLGNSETIVLMKDGKFMDGVNAKSTPYGSSIGRMDGKKGFYYFSTPTKNAENNNNGKRLIADNPEFNYKPGVYSKADTLYLKLKNPDLKVHYTLDGSEPSINSPLIKDSLKLTKGSVIRAFTEGDSLRLRSGINTMTYILGVNHSIPVMNIAVNRNDLYNYNTGIYVDGPGYTPEWPHKGANYWKKMTKKAHVELFDENEGISVDCGLRIFGGFSRAEPKKSFILKFESEYGNSEVEYDFFGKGEPMELQDLVLRSGSQDWSRCMIRDEFFTSLMQSQSPTLLIQEYRPVALYINAEYFGLYYMREKINKHFVGRKLNLPTDSITIIMSKYTEQGNSKHYHDLMHFVQNNDMSKKENYDHVKKNVELQGLIDYKIGEIYSGNSDVGNIRYVRSTVPESDKKWHFVFYDLDASWVGMKPPVEYYLGAGSGASSSEVQVHNILINRLLKNAEFRALFLQRLSHHLTNTISKEHATSVFDNLVAQIQPEMERNCERWPQLSYQQWEKNIKDFKVKFEEKPKVVLNGVREFLNVTPEENKKYFGHLGY